MRAVFFASIKQLSILIFLPVFFLACKKEVAESVTDMPVFFNGFSLSASRLTLLQCNAGNTALTVKWQTNEAAFNKGNKNYTIEIALDGSNFEDKLEVSTMDTNLNFSTDELNKQLLKLIPPGSTAKVAIRVRVNMLNQSMAKVYSDAQALWVTTYQYYHAYEYPQYIKIPGNYGNWILPTSPEIVSEKNDGEYEGYIQFTNAYPQFLMVKGTRWTTFNTYQYIGNNKFGFNGSMFSIFGGSGVYLLKASTNTNTWSYTKINKWTVHGSATGSVADTELMYDKETHRWSATVSLQKGEFRIRANNDDKINMGQKTVNGYRVPACDGSHFVIDKAGTYFISLSLLQAGNYSCSVVKQVN